MRNCERCVHQLLDAGADKDAQGGNGNTPLMHAVCGNCRSLVKLLVEAECNMDLENEKGTTPLMIVASRNLPDIVKMLLGKGKTAERGGVAKLNDTAAFSARGLEPRVQEIRDGANNAT